MLKDPTGLSDGDRPESIRRLPNPPAASLARGTTHQASIQSYHSIIFHCPTCLHPGSEVKYFVLVIAWGMFVNPLSYGIPLRMMNGTLDSSGISRQEQPALAFRSCGDHLYRKGKHH